MAGSEDLRLPDEIREGVYKHLEDLRRGFEKKMGSGGRVGFGERPALIVIDLAMGWTDPKYPNGTDLESVVEDTCKVLEVARQADIPIFFTTMAYGKDDPISPSDLKRRSRIRDEYGSPPTLLDPRLGRQPTEKLIVKKYASCFKGTDLHEMLASLKVDTLIITGCSTSHCVYATCRDAASSFRVIVPEGAVGERCELFHLVNLLDIDLGLGDVVPLEKVVNYLKRIVTAQPVGTPP